MISIDNISINITKGIHLEEKFIQHMYGCKCCGYSGMLHRHGHYDRNVITMHCHFIISIQRFICPCCNKTYSNLPSFLIPYFIYSYDVVIFCLKHMFSVQISITEISSTLRELNCQSFISVQSILFFKKRFYLNIHLINSFFAYFNSYHYDSDLSVLSVDRASSVLVSKIQRFNEVSSFNYEYFKRMPKYFLST